MSGPEWKIDDDLKTVTVTFPTSPAVQIRLDVTAVEEVLKNLGDFRNVMHPEVPHQHAPGQGVQALVDPAWLTEPDIMRGDSILHIRDPRFGWLHYLLPRAQSRKLAALLQAQVDIAPSGPPLGRAS